MLRYDFRKPTTREHLLEYLGIPDADFEQIAHFNGTPEQMIGETNQSRCKNFLRHEIPKKGGTGGERIVWEVSPVLSNYYKVASRRLATFFEVAIPGSPHPKCFGYVRGKNIHENAALHVGALRLLKADVRAFFPSVTSSRLSGFLAQLNVDAAVIPHLVQFLTIDDHIALGLATSPVVANAFCFNLDVGLERLAQSYSAVYSRYADDLTFSSDDALPAAAEIGALVQGHGFLLADEKTRWSKRGQSHYVTGLSISDHIRPHAPRRMKHDLRQVLFFAEKYGLSNHLSRIGIPNAFTQAYVNHFDGIANYVAFHEPKLAPQILHAWQKVLSDAGVSVSFAPKTQHIGEFDFYVDESEFKHQGRTYLALAISASMKQGEIIEAAQNTLKDFLASPWADGQTESIKKNGLHYTDAMEDLRMSFVKVMQKLPFNGYIVFGELSSPSNYANVYTNLLERVITRRLMAAESRNAKFWFEATDKVPQEAIRKVVSTAFTRLRSENNRRPKEVEVHFVGKEATGISVPDFLLGAFRGFMMAGPVTSPPQRTHILFERLRDKVRVILDADSGAEFSRRNPIYPLGTYP